MIGMQLLIAALLLGLVCVGAYFYSQKCIELFVKRDAEDLDSILHTRSVPARWCAKSVRRIARMKACGADEKRIERARARASNRYVRRMGRVMAFARGAPVFESDGHRRAAISDLEAIREEWRRREYLHDPY